MGAKRVRRGRIGRTVKLVFTAALMGFAAITYYQLQGRNEDWPRLLLDWPALLLTGSSFLLALSGLAWLWLGPLRRPKRQEDGSLIFARSAMARTWSAVGGVLITGIAAVVVTRHGFSWFMLGIFGFVFLVSAYQLFRPRGPLTLSSAGLHGADRRHPTLAWSAIESLSFTERNETASIEIKLVPSVEIPESTVTRNVRPKRKPQRIYLTPSEVGADPDVLMNALENFRERYGRVDH